MITITETKEVNFKTINCMCGTTPDVKDHKGSGYSISVEVKCTNCGMSVSDSSSNIGFGENSLTLQSFASQVVSKWNRMLQPVEHMRNRIKELEKSI